MTYLQQFFYMYSGVFWTDSYVKLLSVCACCFELV